MTGKDNTYWQNLLDRFCTMKGFELKWFDAERTHLPGKWHCMCIAGKYPLRGTFNIRTQKSFLYPGTNVPTYITSTWVTPTEDTFNEVAKKIIQTSFGNWWTGSQYKKIGKTIYLCDDYAFKFPSSESELNLVLAVNGY